MEHIYRWPRHHLLLLILVLSLQCVRSAEKTSNANSCCNGIESDGQGWRRYSSDVPSADAIDLLPALVERNRLDWTTAARKPNITCTRSALQSPSAASASNATAALSTPTATPPPSLALPTPAAEASGRPHGNHTTIANESNEYSLLCEDALIVSVADYIQAQSIPNGLSPGERQQQQPQNESAANRPNATSATAIVLRNIRLSGNRIRHRSQYDGNHYRSPHGRQMAIVDNATVYLAWTNSGLDGEAFAQWINQQSDINEQHGFARLAHLDVSQNQIANLTWNMLAAMPNLQTLNASHNAIDGELNLSADWFQQSRLHRLILSNNRIKSIAHTGLDHRWTEFDVNVHDAIKMVTASPADEEAQNLTELDLSYNQINHLQPHAFESNRLPNLKYLNLAHNQLSIIPFQVFEALRALEHLDLSSNRLVTFLDNFFIRNGALKSLNLRNNSIRLISESSLNGLSQAIELDLSNNYIKSIDRNAFNSLTALQTLNLCANQINVLPTTLFYRVGQLKRVNLSRNQFKVLPNGIFANQHNLEWLHIDDTAVQVFGNWISRQPNSIDKNVLRQLRHVSIRDNRQLREIDATTFRNLPAVVHLNLSGNNLLSLPMEIGELSDLTHLDISNNDLISVPKQLSALQRLRTINLLGNNYACDCQMVWLAKWIAEARYNVVLNNGTVTAPLNQLKYLSCRQGYPGDFLRVLEQQQCHAPAAIHVTESKTYLLRTDAQLECSFSGNPMPDIIWVTPLNKIIRYYADPDAKPSNFSASSDGHSAYGMRADLEHQAKNREKIEHQMLKQKQIKFTAATEANGVTLLENGTLRVHNISRKDSGLYICYGYNVMGTARSDIR